ncbi:MAG: aromatic amino acid lyase, partial [Anaerolineae bacterium]
METITQGGVVAKSLHPVRGAMLGRINVHAHGNSGCRLEITETYVEMLNKGVTPFACQKGSVGACG